MASWTFSRLESGFVRLASDAGHVLDMAPAALGQMLASELLTMLERRVADAVGAVEAHFDAPAESTSAAADEQPAEQPAADQSEVTSDGGQAQ